MTNHLNNKLWKTIVDNMPISAKDLLIYSEKKGLLMGKRKNKPAKNFYFVPGGRVFKDENKNQAIGRIAKEETDLYMNNRKYSSIGIYDHFYNDSIWDNSNIKTHYIVEAILILIDDNEKPFYSNEQHSEFKWINKTNLMNYYVHEYSKKYLFDILSLKN